MRNVTQIFVSYEGADNDFAHRLASDLQTRGAPVWIAPESIAPGKNYVMEISNALDGSSHVAVVLTPGALDSAWVEQELSVAIELERAGEITLVPLEVEPCPIPAVLRTYQRIAFHEGYTEGLDRLTGILDLEVITPDTLYPGEAVQAEEPTGLAVDTPLGRTLVSNTPHLPPSGAAVGTHTSYQHPQFGYQLTWPLGGSWILRNDLAMQHGIPTFLTYHQSFGNFTPNLNVTIEQVGQLRIRQWIEIGNMQFAQMGYEIVNNTFDDLTQSGMRVARNESFAGVLYQVQRAVIRNGVAYVATASKLEADHLAFPQLFEEMRGILNSFHVPG